MQASELRQGHLRWSELAIESEGMVLVSGARQPGGLHSSCRPATPKFLHKPHHNCGYHFGLLLGRTPAGAATAPTAHTEPHPRIDNTHYPDPIMSAHAGGQAGDDQAPPAARSDSPPAGR